ncbi:MAG TPA: hypothetical protein VGC93_00515, partial [Thermoanaerobaculia bacterium]
VHRQATGACDTQPPQRGPGGFPLHPRRVRMLAPRVDERRCARAGGAPGTDLALVGFAAGRPVWQRPLAFASGPWRLDRQLIGAAREGLVLSDLEVWSPASGKTIVPARTHAVAGESRRVPDHEVHGAALYHPRRRAVYLFAADVTLLRRDGGVFRLDLASGERTLVVPVATTLLGGFDRVEEMALAGGGRYLLLAQRLETRGPGAASLAVVDLESGERVFVARHGEGHVCADPRLVAGAGRDFGFAYRDGTERRWVVVHYRLASPA